MFGQTSKTRRDCRKKDRNGLRLSTITILCLFIVPGLLAGCATTPNERASIPSIGAMKAQMPQTAVPMPAAGPPPVSQIPNGSLYTEGKSSLFQDVKARQIGDVVTITVSESSAASKAATTSTSKTKAFSGNFTFGGAGLNPSGIANPKGQSAMGPYSGTFANTYKGDASTSKTDSMTAYMTATVVDILPNGNMIIRGTRWTSVNNEMQQIVLEGIIRPNDVTATNTIQSQQIADAKIFFVGKGPVSQSQKPGWAAQFLDIISPF